jgi:hypothetical protein
MSEHASPESIRHLDRAIAELKRESDVGGLLRVHALALDISDRSDGRTQRRAQRLANKALGAVRQLHQTGAARDLEQQDRTTHEVGVIPLLTAPAVTAALEHEEPTPVENGNARAPADPVTITALEHDEPPAPETDEDEMLADQSPATSLENDEPPAPETDEDEMLADQSPAALVEHEALSTHETAEAQVSLDPIETALLDRLVTLLHLLLFEGSAVSSEVGSVEMLAAFDDEGFLQIEIPAELRSRADVLVAGFERSYALFVGAASRKKKRKKQEQQLLGRALKALAVELVYGGADLRDSTEDPVPLIAYGLFDGQLSLEIDSQEEVTDTIDDIMLGFASDSANVPSPARASFITLFRLALLLGEAQAFAEHESVTALTFEST